MLKGIQTGAAENPLQRSAFRTSFFAPDGAIGAHVLECQVVDYNTVNWTVDVVTKYDQRKYFGIQIGSPYMHWNKGEGIFCFPDLGAKGHVCLPSDSTPPYMLDFIMPMETIDQDQAVGNASLAGGRTRAKPGDLYIKGRDGNFCVLHRGGVLQIGATELAQRIYIPLQNLITDISQNYDHLNTGGSLRWYVDGGDSEANPGTVFKQTLRLLAGSDKASIRIAAGKVRDVVRESDSDIRSDLSQIGFDSGGNTVCEVVLSPDGFNASDGSVEKEASNNLVLRYFFDEKGNLALRTKGAINVNSKRLRLRLKESFEVFGTDFNLSFSGTGRLQAEASLDIVGGMVTVNGGKQPVATVGSTVSVAMTPGVQFSMIVPPATAPVIATLVAGPTMTGLVDSGVPNFLA